MNRLS